jgi:DNA uptake protein ComE-like DNA-binding protein
MSTHDCRRLPANRNKRRGTVLILVLVVIAMLTLAGLAFSQWMLTERRAAQVSGWQVQARALAESGVELTRQFVGRQTSLQDEAGGWYDNAGRFREVLVLDGEQPQDRGRFTILAPRIEDRAATGVRYGLEDESTRIDLWTLLDADQEPGGARKRLLALPGMTLSIADAILDWLDTDDELREFGAEVAYYSSLSPGYAPRNGTPATIEELLLVRGVTRQLLYGVGLGPEGQVKAGQPGSETQSTMDNSDGSMTRGWAAYFTLHGAESNLRPDGTPKIDLNQDDLQVLYEELDKAVGKQWATFIVAYRQYGPSNQRGGPQPRGDPPTAAAGAAKPDLTKEASFTLTSILDLVGSPTRVKFEGAKSEVSLPSPFPDEPAAMEVYLPKLLGNTSVSSAPTIEGRININQAPRAVLMSIPGMNTEIVDQIIAKRVPDSSKAAPGRRYETWLYTEGIVKDLSAMKALMPFVTSGGGVYRARSIGYFDSGGPAIELEAVIDATIRPARVVSWKYAPTARPRVEQH